MKIDDELTHQQEAAGMFAFVQGLSLDPRGAAHDSRRDNDVVYHKVVLYLRIYLNKLSCSRKRISEE